MQIDLDHLHYWMSAIRESSDPKRTLEAFWRGQIHSKIWLIDNLVPFVKMPVSIDIHGGWVGVLASLLFQSKINCTFIRNIDIDPACESISRIMNKGEEIEGKFEAITSDMSLIESDADVVINTSCEHIDQQTYDIWLSKLPMNSLLVLQSNNYDIGEHVRIAKNLEDFKKQSQIQIFWAGEITFPKYTRYMLIGKKNA